MQIKLRATIHVVIVDKATCDGHLHFGLATSSHIGTFSFHWMLSSFPQPSCFAGVAQIK